MSELLTVEAVMRELQIEKEQLKELIRSKELRYTLSDGRVKIPKSALLEIKTKRMTSHTSQIQQQTPTRKLKVSQEKEHVSLEEAMLMLEVSKETLHTLISSQRLRIVEIDGRERVPVSAIEALKIQMPKNPAKQSTRKMQKRKPPVRRKY